MYPAALSVPGLYTYQPTVDLCGTPGLGIHLGALLPPALQQFPLSFPFLPPLPPPNAISHLASHLFITQHFWPGPLSQFCSELLPFAVETYLSVLPPQHPLNSPCCQSSGGWVPEHGSVASASSASPRSAVKSKCLLLQVSTQGPRSHGQEARVGLSVHNLYMKVPWACPAADELEEMGLERTLEGERKLSSLSKAEHLLCFKNVFERLSNRD